MHAHNLVKSAETSTSPQGGTSTKTFRRQSFHASHGCYDTHTNQRWTLFNLYAAFDGDQIASIIALQQATDTKTGSQEQVLVQWQQSVIPGWAVQLAKQLGYHPDQQRLATEEETMTQGVDTGCECCLLKDTQSEEADLPTCSCCLRSYHTDCLPTQHVPDGRKPRHVEDTAWNCQYCHQLLDARASTGVLTQAELLEALPVELRWYKVDWKHSAEPLSKIIQILEMQPAKTNTCWIN